MANQTQSREGAIEQKDDESRWDVLDAIGTYYEDEDLLDKALSCYQECLTIAQEMNKPLLLLLDLSNQKACL